MTSARRPSRPMAASSRSNTRRRPWMAQGKPTERLARDRLLLFFLSSTVIGVRCKDGVVMGVEKMLVSKMLVEGTNRMLHSCDEHLALVS
jgi:hypothetical protein